MQTSLTIFLQTKVRGASRIIISWAFKNSSNINPQFLPLAGNSNIDNTCFSCQPWRFFSLFVFRSKIPCNKGQTKNSCTSPFMSLNISGYPIFILQALISQKSLKYKVGLQVRLSKVYTYIVNLRKPSNDCLPSEPMIMRVSS